MGLKLPVVLSDGFLKAMPESERKKLGKAGMTKGEALAKWAAGKEKELQDLIATDLFRRGIWFDRSRMDKKTTGRKGKPDFIICAPPFGRLMGVEVKATGGILSKEQAHQGEQIQSCGGAFHVVYNFEEYRKLIL